MLHKKIIVTLNSNENKRKLAKTSKKLNLMTKHLKIKWDDNIILIDEQLTYGNRNVFYEAKNRLEK